MHPNSGTLRVIFLVASLGATLSPAVALPLHDRMVTGTILNVSDEEPAGNMQGYDVPGRNHGSQAPWKFFLGNAAHRLIGYIYGVNHPQSRIFYNNDTVSHIVRESRLGNASLLLETDRNICPDITDVDAMVVFEIKPENDRGIENGQRQLQAYLAALNRAILTGGRFSPGIAFDGEILIRFAQGLHIWRLSWRTTEPGLVLYRWTRSQQRFASEADAYNAGTWVELSEGELEQYGRWIGKAVEGMVNRREKFSAFSGVVGVVIDTVGSATLAFLTGRTLGQTGSSGTARQSTIQPTGGAKVIPFPLKAPSGASPIRFPAAGGQ